jgi:hypothetical protein
METDGNGWKRIESEYLLIENYNLKLNFEKKDI